MNIIFAIKNYFLMRHLKKTVKQGTHHRKITEHMKKLVVHFRNEFTEDNKDIQDQFMRSCLEKALKS